MAPPIGRREELRLLTDASRDSAAGNGRFYMVAGEPGIGKTRLAQEFCREAKSNGHAIAWSRCWEGQGSPPYWPWIQLIRECLNFNDSAQRLLESGSTHLRNLVPEFDKRGAASAPINLVPTPPPGERTPSERFRLFESLADFFRRISATVPLVMVVEDIHAADADSLRALLFVARELQHSRILMIATFRDVEARLSAANAEIFGALAREGHRIDLPRLSESEVGELIAAHKTATGVPDLAHVLFRATEGNPLFLEEVLRLLKTERMRDPVERIRQGTAIPDGIRDIVRTRMGQLSDGTKNVLAVAAVIGRDFDATLLTRVSQFEPGKIFEHLDEAVAYGLIRETAEAPARYQFTQTMVADTIAAELSKSRLLELHRQVADHLEQLHHADPASVLTKIAHHYMKAVPLASAAKAIDYSVRAARRALNLFAYEEAERLATLAVEASPLDESTNVDRACEALLVLAEAQSKADKIEAGRKSFMDTARLARKLGRSDLLARIALEMDSLITAGAVDRELVSLLEESLAAFDDRPTVTRAMLLAKLAASLYWSESGERIASLCEQAVALARRLDDVGALIFALWRQHYALWTPENLEQRLAIANEMIGLAGRLHHPEWTRRAHEMRIADLLELGDFQSAEAEVLIYEKVYADLGQNGSVQIISAMRALLRGELAEAERQAEEAMNIGLRRQQPRALTSYAAQLTMIRFEQGRLKEMESLLGSYIVQFPQLDVARCALILASIESENQEQARTQFEYFARDDFAHLRRDWNWLATVTVAAQVSVYLGDTARAESLYRYMLPFARRNVMLGWYEICYGSASRTLGLLTTLLGRYDEAEKHFESALALNRRFDARTWVARTQASYAEMLLARVGPGDVERAFELARSAMETAKALELRSLERDLTSCLARCNQHSQPIVAALTQVSPIPSPASTSRFEGTVTIMFSDIEHSTMATERLGDLRAQELWRVHNDIVRQSLALFGGYEVKTLGDGFMVAFASARRAILCAISIQKDLSRYSRRSAEPLPLVRIGLHTGEPIREAGDFFGKSVIVAARIGAQANGGEILVSAATKEMVQAAGDLRFDGGQEVKLKGLSGSYTVYSVQR